MNILSAILKCKCPQCRQGDVFSHPAYNLVKFSHMNNQCEVCEFRLEPEPGFYQGAMYVSYGFSVIALIVIGILLYYTINPGQWVYITTIMTTTLLLVPLNFRYSRIVYLYSFGGIKFRSIVSRAK